MPHGYMDFWGWIDDIYDVIPDADVRGYHSPGTGVAYPGNFYQAVPLASGNPEATYWLMRYLASEEAQRAMIEKAMAGTRMDVLSDPKYQTGDWERAVGRQNAALDMLFTTTETAEVMDDYIWFNSTAGGKIYEMTIIKCHEAVVGIKTIDDAVDEIINQMVSLQTKYGDLPVRNET